MAQTNDVANFFAMRVGLSPKKRSTPAMQRVHAKLMSQYERCAMARQAQGLCEPRSGRCWGTSLNASEGDSGPPFLAFSARKYLRDQCRQNGEPQYLKYAMKAEPTPAPRLFLDKPNICSAEGWLHESGRPINLVSLDNEQERMILVHTLARSFSSTKFPTRGGWKWTFASFATSSRSLSRDRSPKRPTLSTWRSLRSVFTFAIWKRSWDPHCCCEHRRV